MRRCVKLALAGAGETRSNPMVGAVLVHDGRIIGEGYHERYGEAHAEVNCIRSVTPADQHLIADSTIYVSLEPCAHFGKTPPCADLIIKHGIRHVVIGAGDPFPGVDGKGIAKLRNEGLRVDVGILEADCRAINRRFFTFHEKKRPYIILKWAETADRFIGSNEQRLMISNDLSQRLVHRWRSEEMAIMVGTNTASADDPELTVRKWTGNNPVRIVADRQLRLPGTLKLFDGIVETIVLNDSREGVDNKIEYIKTDKKNTDSNVEAILHAIAARGITSVIVEGGRQLIQSFIEKGYWDEARVITNQQMFTGKGISAPDLKDPVLFREMKLKNDQIRWFRNASNAYQLNLLNEYERC
ncbi:MAG: bifunctional diaminohydroxyphosphoribosylaminopyrimidine deaminase/5-amino-6-(5-phosphoribosylamino)uracil reductase RibD [Chitinophagaceae bacterium]|nr:MAG: bifunctional diaminohydroxyphosphoribosylaminopyrimidine deaminase/5-amino-6-(5-phosphoribosylamino)uracil reductase RibD [Chitinophagaceae bacterium]